MEKKEIHQLIVDHNISTMYCSLPGHMRKCSTTYDQIISLDKEAVPVILEYMRDYHKDNMCAGMSVVLLLMDIVKESPYTPTDTGTGFVSYTVKDCEQTWIDWGIKNGYIV